MQSISRFLAVLIALIFLIGPLAGTAAAHEAEDGDHEDATYGELSLTRLDGLGDSVHVGQMLQFGVTFTQADDDHLVPDGIDGGDTDIVLMGMRGEAPTALTVGGAERTLSYTVDALDLAGAASRSVTLFVQYMYTPTGDEDEDVGVTQPHPQRTIKSDGITITVLPILSPDATLKSLKLSDVKLSAEFAAGTVGYTADVAHDVTETTVTAVPNHAGASAEVTVGTGDDEVVYDGAVPLDVGANAIIVKVTAEDGTSTNGTYTVEVTRAGAPIDDGVVVTFTATLPEPEEDADAVVAGQMVTFAIGVTTGEHAIDKRYYV